MLVLVAIGLAITFGVMGVINMAHGELMMLGAYTTYVVQTADAEAHRRRRSSWRFRRRSSSPALAGVLIERTIIRFLYGRPLETLLATFGVSLVLQQLGALDVLGAQPIGRDAGVDERHAADQRRAGASPTTGSTSCSSR